jgi:hypothetical protein
MGVVQRAVQGVPPEGACSAKIVGEIPTRMATQNASRAKRSAASWSSAEVRRSRRMPLQSREQGVLACREETTEPKVVTRSGTSLSPICNEYPTFTKLRSRSRVPDPEC